MARAIGSAPGLANVVARESVDHFDSVDSIEFVFYDGVWSNRFIPFWWSLDTAFDDMASAPIIYENGAFKTVPPFNDPQWVDFRGLGRRRIYDHHHEEPISMGLVADQYLKGVKNVRFRYGGPSTDLAKHFYNTTARSGRREFFRPRR